MKSPPGANQADAALSNRSFIHPKLLSISARAQYRGRAASLYPYIDTLRRRRERASGPRLVRGCKTRGTRKYSSRSVFFPCKKAPHASAVFSCTSRDDATPHCMCCISDEHVGRVSAQCLVIHLFESNASNPTLPLEIVTQVLALFCPDGLVRQSFCICSICCAEYGGADCHSRILSSMCSIPSPMSLAVFVDSCCVRNSCHI